LALIPEQQLSAIPRGSEAAKGSEGGRRKEVKLFIGASGDVAVKNCRWK
jgi:hypothetical protein